MKSELVPEGDLLTPMNRCRSNRPSRRATRMRFSAQQQKIQRLHEYYNQVVAELLWYFNESEKEAA